MVARGKGGPASPVTLDGMSRTSILALASFAALLALAPAPAEACACCDGSTDRRLLGWNERGLALVRSDASYACEHRVALEIWAPATPAAPVGCFDLQAADPDRRVGCDALVSDWIPEDRWRPSRRPAEYGGPVRSLRARWVRATLDPLPLDSDEDPYGRRTRLEVFVAVRGRFERVLSVELARGAPPDPSEEETGEAPPPLPIEIAIHPTPDGRRALLSFSGHDSMPGHGHWPRELRFIPLPEGVGGAAGAPAAFVDGVVEVTAVVTPGPVADAASRRRASAANRAALAQHRAGDYARSAAGFEAALRLDRGDAMARYNLACALARLGRVEAAIAELQAIRDAGCARCAGRLRAARGDPDFASLRAVPAFVAVVGP